MIKSFSKISKNLLLKLAKTRKQSAIDSVNLIPEYRDYNKCKSTCPFYNYDRATCDACADCPFVMSTSSINNSDVEREFLTFTQIKQLLLYHSLMFENNGLSPLLTHEFVADKIGCSVKTARNNIKALENAGYIAYYKQDNSYVVIIIGYNKYHKKNNIGGYMNLNKKVLNKILKAETINELRLLLHIVVKADSIKVANKKNFSFKYRDLFTILPSDIYKKEQIYSLFNKIADTLKMFNIEITDDRILIKPDKVMDNEYNKKKVSKFNKRALKKFFKSMFFKLGDKDRDDLMQLSMQYGKQVVINTLKAFDIKNKYNDIKELGSYLRTLIRLNVCENREFLKIT